jgi:hypothetical protein
MKQFLFRSELTWDNLYGYTFEDNLSPQMEIITGETVLHEETDPHIKIHVEMNTTDRRVTPVLDEIDIEWTDSTDVVQTKILTTASDFSTTNSTFLDMEVVNNSLVLGRGSFSGIVDTEGSFRKGAPGKSVVINQNGSISLDLPTI